MMPLYFVPSGGSELFNMFETIRTVTDGYQGPRRGGAEFNGQPHLYRVPAFNLAALAG